MALAHLSDVGWTDHGGDGEQVFCDLCERLACNAAAEEAEVELSSTVGLVADHPQLSWANGMLLGFDLETTGTDPRSDLPVSYSFVHYNKGDIIAVAGSVINPGRVIPEGAIAVHGITNAAARERGRDLKEAITEIAQTLVDTSKANIPVVGMNVSFDLKMIDSASKDLLGSSLYERGWNGPVLDVLVIDRYFDKYRKGGRKLVDLCSHYGVADAEFHDARKDVEACVAVLLRQAAKYPALCGMGLDVLYECQREWHRAWADNFSKYLVSKGTDPLSESDCSWPLDMVVS